MKTALAIFVLITAPLAHADELDDLVTKGGNIFLDKHDAIEAETGVLGRFFCDSSPGAGGPVKCNAQEMAYEQQKREDDIKLSTLAPAAKDNNFLNDIKTLSYDDMLMRAFWDKETVLEMTENLKTCLNSYCTDYKKRLKQSQTRVAEDMVQLRKLAAAKQVAAAPTAAKPLAELKGSTLTLAKGNFGLTDKNDADLVGYKISDPCTATVKFSNFDDFSKMYTGVSPESSWTVGPFAPAYDIGASQENWQNLCKLLDGQKIQAECLNTVQKGHVYHVPDSVVLSSIDGANRMTVYSSDKIKKDEGVRDCLKAENFQGLDGSGQVAGAAAPVTADSHGTASN